MTDPEHKGLIAHAEILGSDYRTRDSSVTVARPRPMRCPMLCLTGALILASGPASSLLVARA